MPMTDEKPEGDEAYQDRQEDPERASTLTQLLDQGLVAAVMHVLRSLTESELAQLPAKLLKRLLRAVEALRSGIRGAEQDKASKKQQEQQRQNNIDRLNNVALVQEQDRSRQSERQPQPDRQQQADMDKQPVKQAQPEQKQPEQK